MVGKLAKIKSNPVDARCLVGGGGHCVVPGSRAKRENCT
jgi:hypothetical protein